MFVVYILQSQKTQKYYIGSTSDIVKRLVQHNSGSTRSTKFGRPWVVVYEEGIKDKISALAREKQIKSYKGGRAFKALIQLDQRRSGRVV